MLESLKCFVEVTLAPFAGVLVFSLFVRRSPSSGVVGHNRPVCDRGATTRVVLPPSDQGAARAGALVVRDHFLRPLFLLAGGGYLWLHRRDRPLAKEVHNDLPGGR